ncbi:MAG: DUF6542 domain-containing protein [Actinomycetota bacterium]
MSEGTAVGEATGGAPTGRLFRSLRADGDAASGAVPALSLDQAVGLKTVTLGDGGFGAAAPVPIVTPSPAEDAFLDDPVADADVADAAVADAAVAGTTYGGGRRGAHAAPGIRASGVWLVVIGVTVLVAFADVIVVGTVNWITGVALLAASIYGAFMVRKDDWPIAVIAPPLAMFLAVITAGQLTLGPISDFLVNEALMILITLGDNVLWVFGATVAALVIVLVRRSRWS